jgi:BON domain
LGGVATQVNAQNAPAPGISRSVSIAASTAHGAYNVPDEDLRKRVKAALHADPYFYDEHVTVSIENGGVALRGFVFSDWDLREALRIARQAAGDKPVIDNLSIKEGGYRSALRAVRAGARHVRREKQQCYQLTVCLEASVRRHLTSALSRTCSNCSQFSRPYA